MNIMEEFSLIHNSNKMKKYGKSIYIPKSEDLSILSKLNHSLRGKEAATQDGFFRASIRQVYDAKLVSINQVQKKLNFYTDDISAVFINYKSFNKYFASDPNFLNFLSKFKNSAKVLVVTNSQAENMPENKLLDHFDLVFKREHFRDVDKYNLSHGNKLKIRTTMISCPLIHAPDTFHGIWRQNFKQPPLSQEKAFDISFVGHNTNMLRAEALQLLQASDLKSFFALQPKPAHPVPQDLQGPRLSLRKYRELIGHTRVNLALDGYGQFTYRHLEVLALGGFLLSGPSIRELALPIDIEEERTHVCFEDLDDLIDKVKFYAANAGARAKIAQEGNKAFNAQYDFADHGRYIRDNVENL